MKVHILDDWLDTLRELPGFRLLDGHDVSVWNDHIADVDLLAERLRDAEALVLFRERSAIGEELVSKLPNLRLISQRGAYPHVDVEALTRHGILLCSKKPVGGVNHATTELTWALILAASRQLPQQMAALKAGQWQTAVGTTLHGKTLGVYGYGRIGRAVADIARAFGMQVICWGSEAGRDRARLAGEQVPASRQAFFESVDVLTLHQRLVAETRGGIIAADLSQMKPSSVLVNTARSELIEKGALYNALRAGHPGAAGVDVFDHEPVAAGAEPLLELPNVVATPHLGYVTKEEFDLQFSDIYEQVNAFAAGDPIHMINPKVFNG